MKNKFLKVLLTCEPQGASSELLTQNLATFGTRDLVFLSKNIGSHLLGLESNWKKKNLFEFQHLEILTNIYSLEPCFNFEHFKEYDLSATSLIKR